MVQQLRTESCPYRFRVVVEEETVQTDHIVTMDQMTLDKISRIVGPKCPLARIIDASFRFLLDREPKEAILNRFDMTLISHNFPEYYDQLKDYVLSAGSDPVHP
ncbi:MAG: hypothetical protein HQL63_10940 [Magnetococcales bacterium]|nr:hypothetical protein [Magnetococcales bacterium]MBF0323081.1 hypothetical protein [Magnetococcales bacterium]